MTSLGNILKDLRRSLTEWPDERMQETGADGEVLVAHLRIASSLIILTLPGLHYSVGGSAIESFLGLIAATGLLLTSHLWLKLANRRRAWRWLPFASSCFDVLLVGALLLLLGLYNEAKGLSLPVAWSGYPLAIIATILRNDVRVTLIAGGLATLQSLFLILLLDPAAPSLALQTASLSEQWQHLVMLMVLTLVTAMIVLRTQHLLQLSGNDGLTGLPNRSFLNHRVPRLIADARAEGQTLTLALLDFDHFRRINEDFGHLAADRALLHIVNILRLELRRDESLIRVGGGEFLIILRLPLGAAWERVDKLRYLIETQPFMPESSADPVRITISAGLACMPQDANNLSDLMKRADRRVALAKNMGRNRVMVRDNA